MRNKKFGLSCLTIFVVSLAAGAIQTSVDFSGTWVGNYQFSEDDNDQLTLILKKSGTGYQGVINDSLSFLKKETPLAEVRAENKTISFSFTITFDTGSQTIEMILTLDGDKLGGTISSKEKGAGEEIEFIRKKS
jgi:hypothetical protein